MTTGQKDKSPRKDRDSLPQLLCERATSPLSFTAAYHYYPDIDVITDPGPLAGLLGIGGNFLSDREKKVLSILENDDKRAWPDCSYLEFKWKIVSFLSVQDIFDAPLMPGSDLRSLFRQWYFYYESKYLLIETILCSLNGFMGAQGSLLRLFLEFNLLQNYFFRNINDQGSYALLENYHEKGTGPNWNTVIKGAMPDNTFTRPIKRRILSHLQALSEHSSHPYRPAFTLTRTGSALPEPTLERLFMYTFTALVLDVVLWLYYINFPMLFNGVDVERKFAFNAPVGIFVDEQTSKIIGKSLDKRSYEAFRDYAKGQTKVAELLAWYNQKESLTDQQIIDTWNAEEDGPIEDVVQGHCLQVVKMRGLKQAMALQNAEEPSNIPEGQEEQIFGRIFSYFWWKEISRRMK
jgi:hypothetical protein